MNSLALRTLLLALTVTLHISSVQSSGRICPLPECDGCRDPAQQSAPGIGFHLGLTAGTVAVSHDDGHFENVISIPGSPEYVALMQDFTTHPSRLDPPPLDNAAERAHAVWLIARRRMNLLLGRPGTPEAGTISAMLSSLRSKTESHLSTSSISTVGIALANAALASHQEINDALNYAGLKPLGQLQIEDHELNAAYGAYGFGLCPSYRDPYKCEEEEDAFGLGDSVLHLDFTAKTLAANTALISTARSTYATTEFTNWELGRDEATEKWTTEDDYWNAVEAAIRDLTSAAGRRPYSQLLLTGERAGDQKFLEVVRDALQGSDIADQTRTSQPQMSYTYMVARGAAEFQRRRQQGWLRCVPSKHCPKTLGRKMPGSEKPEQVLEL